MNATVNAPKVPLADATVLMGSAVAVVKTYLQSNSVPHDQLPGLLRQVYAAMAESFGASTQLADAVAEIDTATSPLKRPARKRKMTKADIKQAEAERKEAERKLRISKISTLPVVPVDESVHEDGIICLIDGKKKLMLKRHLRARYGMEWHEYVAHFGLQPDYPSVAPGYSEIKRREAVRQGLGVLIDKTPRHLRTARKPVTKANTASAA